jgi:hypothetical protein
VLGEARELALATSFAADSLLAPDTTAEGAPEDGPEALIQAAHDVGVRVPVSHAEREARVQELVRGATVMPDGSVLHGEAFSDGACWLKSRLGHNTSH